MVEPIEFIPRSGSKCAKCGVVGDHQEWNGDPYCRQCLNQLMEMEL